MSDIQTLGTGDRAWTVHPVIDEDEGVLICWQVSREPSIVLSTEFHCSTSFPGISYWLQDGGLKRQLGEKYVFGTREAAEEAVDRANMSIHVK